MHATEETDYKQLLSFIMHDLRHINAMIRDSARLLGIATNLGNVDQDPPRQASRIDVESIRHHASIVLEQAAILSLWLAIADMYIEPERFAKEPMRLISLHEIFYKAIINFKRLAGKKNVKIKLNGQGKFQVNAHPVLEIMPYILLDN